VLVRAVEDIETQALIDGPGRICRFLAIDRTLNRVDLTIGGTLWVEDRGGRVPPSMITAGPRVNVDYAGTWASKPWRFRLAPSRKLKARNKK